jgi:putative membrane protein
MFFELLVALLIGSAAGIVTGLAPGVHINLVSVLLLSASPFLLNYVSPFFVAVLIIAMSITHTFLDSIPSIFLGAPDADTVLAVLPGHKMLLDGKGHEAVRLKTEGSLLCLILGTALTPLFIIIFPRAYAALKDWIGWLLLGIVVWLLWREKGGHKKFWSAFTFLAAGVLGIIVLATPSLNQPLLPLLSGLFGVSGLLLSLFENTEIPKQHLTDQLHASPRSTIEALGAGTLAGAAISLFPGLGPAQAAVIAGFFFPNTGNLGYLLLVGGINTVNFLVSLVTMYTLQKARNGAMIVALEIVKQVSTRDLLLCLAVCLTVGGIATLLTLWIARGFSALISRVNYRMLCLGTILLVVSLVAVFSGMLGLFVLVISTSIGLIPSLTGTGKSHAMGCLLVPVILFFLVGA